MISQMVFCCLLLACVSKSELTGRDYRLFQNTPAWDLAQAVQDEDVKEIDKIVKESPELINYQEPKYGNTLLMLTIMNQQMKPFKALLERNADVSIHNTYDGTSALIEACRLKFYDIKYAQMLIDYGADINDVETGERKKGNSTRETPLISATNSGKIEFVELLVKNGVNINYKNEFGQSALSQSVKLKNYDISLYLLQNGADYKQPVFYRPDYTMPSELEDPNDKGEPVYLWDVLREDFSDLDTDEYKNKMQIVDFLKSKGIDYRAMPIPDYIREKAKEEYPETWQEYLEKY